MCSPATGYPSKTSTTKIQVEKGEDLDIFTPWDCRSVLNTKDGCFIGMRATPNFTSSRTPASGAFTESFRCRPAPTQWAPALSAPDISLVHIRAGAAHGCVWDWQQFPHPPQEPFPAEESGEGLKGQHSRGPLPTLAQGVEKSCAERGRRNLNYSGLPLVGRRQQSWCNWEKIWERSTYLKENMGSLCPIAGLMWTTLMGLKTGTPWVSDWKSKTQQKIIESQNDLCWKGP